MVTKIRGDFKSEVIFIHYTALYYKLFTISGILIVHRLIISVNKLLYSRPRFNVYFYCVPEFFFALFWFKNQR